MYYAAEDLGYADATTADARRVKTRQIAAGIAALTSHLRQRLGIFEFVTL